MRNGKVRLAGWCCVLVMAGMASAALAKSPASDQDLQGVRGMFGGGSGCTHHTGGPCTTASSNTSCEPDCGGPRWEITDIQSDDACATATNTIVCVDDGTDTCAHRRDGICKPTALGGWYYAPTTPWYDVGGRYKCKTVPA